MAAPPASTNEGPPSTPANEWTANPTASLSAESGINSTSKVVDDNKEHEESTELPPGPDFPGAYPGDFDESEAFTTSDAKNAAIGVLHTAKQFIPTQQDVGKAMLTASEKAKQYLPNAVTSYFPSSAIRSNAKEEVASTGSDLPGRNDERGVAILPDERNLNDRCTSTPSFSGIPNGMDSTVPPPITNEDSSKTESSSVTNLSTQAQAGSDTTATSPPTTPTTIPPLYPPRYTPLAECGAASKDTTPQKSLPALPPNGLKSPDIVQDVVLPGNEASSLSKTDAHTVQQPIVNTTPRTHPLGKQGATWRGVSLAESPEISENELSSGVNGKDENHPAKNDIPPPTTHHPALSSQPITPSDASHMDHKRVDSTSSNTSGSSRNAKASKSRIKSGSGSSTGSPQRSKFIDRIKGEVKVISGKLAHNEEKVEEGRRLLGKAT